MPEGPTSRLSRHYDERYSNRCIPTNIVPFKRFPRNRFEAAVKWGNTGKRLLEIGAGSGNVLKSLVPFYEECIGTEISKPRIESLKEIFAEDPSVNILYHNLEYEQLPFPDEHFDTILMIAVVEHLVDPVPALKQVRRVLKEGGRLIVDTPNFAKWTRRVKLLFGYFPATASKDEGLLNYDGSPTDLHDEGHLHYFTYRSLSMILRERVGFRRVLLRGYGALGPLCRVWPTLFSDIFVIAVK